ncbi:hypothetical protein FB465_5035 [Kitasatospora atroaurantiaca]|uniref:Uncharacterized protein n=1 Tax=Kitasatospora atroaurantiaca TaxID=285545 RepID=A0A561EWC0_9ACTN|nr:hypothetical protein FB465_5035 [Kitasatospora atroaurantiaca]
MALQLHLPEQLEGHGRIRTVAAHTPRAPV